MEWKQLLSKRRIRSLLNEDSRITPVEEFRSEFEKDYGRAAFCTPVKRLQDKAQVFPLEPIDAVRTRLTHSLEVSSVARSLCRLVAHQLADPKFKLLAPEFTYDVETIGATCGLLHDIGNPPFGHSGEDAIRAWFKTKVSPKTVDSKMRAISFFGESDDDHRFEGDILNYEGNAQTIRLISRLQVVADRRGLNLTSAVFSALSKYTADSLSINKDVLRLKKVGHFNSEKHIVSLVQEETGTRKARHPLAYLIEASDDICYLLGDLEDAVKKSVIRWSDVSDALNQDKKGKELLRRTKKFRQKNSKLHSAKSLDECSAQYFRVIAMHDFVVAVAAAFMSRHDSIMSGSYENELMADCTHKSLFKVIKDFSRETVYTSKETLRLEVLGYRIIRDLLEEFDKARGGAKSNTIEGKMYQLISSNYRSVFEHKEKWEKNFPEDYRRILLITDYVCGMTDTFALTLHSQLTQGI